MLSFSKEDLNGLAFCAPPHLCSLPLKVGEGNGKEIRPLQWGFLADLPKKVFYEYVGAAPICFRACSIR